MQHPSLASPTNSGGHLRRVPNALAVVLGATVVLMASGMPTARAHDELVATTPAPDATVATPPASVTLQFSRAVLALGTQVLVSGPDGAPVSQGAVEVGAATIVQPLAGDAPAGGYTVSWRVTASDGHPLSGAFAFTVREDTAPSAAPAVSLTDDEALSERTARPPVEDSFPSGPITFGAVVLAVAAGLARLQRRRRT
jgi:MYXO-CTERM domain-containing protein